jgi:tRNA(Ile2) C34 agmatinyltransferase TiaS
MTDFHVGNAFPNPPPTPPCPLCGGEMIAAPVHAAVAKVTDVFRCKRCNVEYPVARKGEA